MTLIASAAHLSLDTDRGISARSADRVAFALHRSCHFGITRQWCCRLAVYRSPASLCTNRAISAPSESHTWFSYACLRLFRLASAQTVPPRHHAPGWCHLALRRSPCLAFHQSCYVITESADRVAYTCRRLCLLASAPIVPLRHHAPALSLPAAPISSPRFAPIVPLRYHAPVMSPCAAPISSPHFAPIVISKRR